MAQGGNPRPDELWTFEAEGGATVNDVAIDADGKVITAVQADGSAVDPDDNEVFAWNLASSKTSSEPVMRDDPSDGIGAPEGLSVVAIEANPGGKGDFIAVGNEGSGDGNQNMVYVYRRSTGGGTMSATTYPDSRDRPDGTVQDLWFLDRNTLLVHHGDDQSQDVLSLLENVGGTEYKETEKGRWNPTTDTPSDEEETIRDVAVSRTTDRVAVLTSKGGGETSDDTLVLRILADDGGELSSIALPWSRSGVATDGQVDFSRDGEFALVGTGSNTIYYMTLHPYSPENADETTPDLRLSELPWSRNGPDDVTGLALSPAGDWLVAGFANAQMIVYQRINVTADGPRAERTLDAPIGTSQPVQQAEFANGNRSLLVQAAGLSAFHQRQFDGGEDVQALWTLPQAQGFAVSEDGQRIAVAGDDDGGVVQAYEQSYEADLSVQTPGTVQPGRAFNLTATIENRGSTFDAYRLQVTDLGSSWNVETPDEPLELLPGETGNTTLTITPGSTQPPGEVTFTVQAISQLGPSKTNVGSADTSVDVQEVHAADLSIDTSQRSIGQGATIELQPEIANAGNTREPITLRVRQEASWTVAIDEAETNEASFGLDPGGSTSPTVSITAPGDTPKGTRNTFKLVAHPADGGTQSRAEITVVVEPSYAAAFEVPSEPVEVEPGQTVNTDVTILNDGNTRDTFTLEAESNASKPEHLWRAELSEQKVTLEDEDEETITVTVTVPRGSEVGDTASVTLRATSSATGDRVGEASYTLEVPEDREDSPVSLVLALAATGLAALAAGRTKR